MTSMQSSNENGFPSGNFRIFASTIAMIVFGAIAFSHVALSRDLSWDAPTSMFVVLVNQAANSIWFFPVSFRAALTASPNRFFPTSVTPLIYPLYAASGRQKTMGSCPHHFLPTLLNLTVSDLIDKPIIFCELRFVTCDLSIKCDILMNITPATGVTQKFP